MVRHDKGPTREHYQPAGPTETGTRQHVTAE